MAAITISRELGSLGSQIARSLADHLGYRMVWREVINEAACRARAPEVALAVIDELGLFGVRPSAKARHAYLQGVQQILTELANAGEVVILGRAGQVILRDCPDVLHVRIIAPTARRVERLVERQHISASAARAQIEKSDATRYTYLKRNYHVDWDDPEL
ncbi:MAG: cytidylate kinase-like family protein, partial [Anaerolineae bacterium]|nr:cytidylate kinase-like family protein [Anaerolineae bacterium]